MPRRFDRLTSILDEFGLGPSSRSAGAARGRRPAGRAGLTLVVGALAAAGAVLAAHLGGAGRAVDPAELDEAGLAQAFDLGDCRLLLIEPGDDTEAERYLLAHGPGLYRITLGG